MATTNKTYTIDNASGLQSRAWRQAYATQAAAAEALRAEMGWGEIVLSYSYAVDEGDAVSAYETQAECDADDNDGMRAPRIVEHAVTDATDAQIRSLRLEARAAGDEAQVALCERALAGDAAARAECATTIAGAR
jgi:hypothetical protein